MGPVLRFGTAFAGGVLAVLTMATAALGAPTVPGVVNYAGGPVSTAALPDGGTSRTFNVAGENVIANSPPVGFDPATASDAELQRYGIPLPDTSGVEPFIQWSDMIKHMRYGGAPTGFTASGIENGISKNRTLNYSGFDVREPNVAYYATSAEMVYVQPTDNGTPAYCYTGGSDDTASFWSGLGNDVNALGQNGTSLSSASSVFTAAGLNNAEWWELITPGTSPTPGAVYPYSGPQTNPQYWYVTPGGPVYVNTTYQGSSLSWVFFWYNYDTAQWEDIEPSTIGYGYQFYSGRDALAIAEDPSTSLNGNSRYPMTNFGTFNVELTAIDYGILNGYTNSPQAQVLDDYMNDGVFPMATTPSLGPDGTWSTTWQRCY